MSHLLLSFVFILIRLRCVCVCVLFHFFSKDTVCVVGVFCLWVVWWSSNLKLKIKISVVVNEIHNFFAVSHLLLNNNCRDSVCRIINEKIT